MRIVQEFQCATKCEEKIAIAISNGFDQIMTKHAYCIYNIAVLCIYSNTFTHYYYYYLIVSMLFFLSLTFLTLYAFKQISAWHNMHNCDNIACISCCVCVCVKMKLDDRRE